MTRICHKHRLQPNPQHQKDDTKHLQAQEQIKGKATSSLFVSKVISNIDRTLSTALKQGSNYKKNPTKLMPKAKIQNALLVITLSIIQTVVVENCL